MSPPRALESATLRCQFQPCPPRQKGWPQEKLFSNLRHRARVRSKWSTSHEMPRPLKALSLIINLLRLPNTQESYFKSFCNRPLFGKVFFTLESIFLIWRCLCLCPLFHNRSSGCHQVSLLPLLASGFKVVSAWPKLYHSHSFPLQYRSHPSPRAAHHEGL